MGCLLPCLLQHSFGVDHLLALSKTMFHLSDFAMVLSAGYTNTMESSMPSGCGLNNNPVARHAEFIRSSTNMSALHFQIG